MKTIGVAVVVGVVVLVFSFFIWPTPFRYETVKKPYFGGTGAATHYEEVWRINRFTGDAVKVLDTNPMRVKTP